MVGDKASRVAVASPAVVVAVCPQHLRAFRRDQAQEAHLEVAGKVDLTRAFPDLVGMVPDKKAFLRVGLVEQPAADPEVLADFPT